MDPKMHPFQITVPSKLGEKIENLLQIQRKKFLVNEIWHSVIFHYAFYYHYAIGTQFLGKQIWKYVIFYITVFFY